MCQTYNEDDRNEDPDIHPSSDEGNQIYNSKDVLESPSFLMYVTEKMYKLTTELIT